MVAKFKKNKRAASRQGIFFSVFFGMLVLLVVGFLIVTNVRISRRRSKLISRIESLKKEVQIFEERNKELRENISQAGSKEYLEKVAREQFGLKAPGEEVVVVTKEEEKKTEEVKKSWWEWIKSKMRW